jgi:hypothetical protein
MFSLPWVQQANGHASLDQTLHLRRATWLKWWIVPRWIVVFSGLQGYTPPMISQEIQLTWFKALSAGWRLWPFVHMLTFSGLIPMQYRLLFVDAVEVRCAPSPLMARRFDATRDGTTAGCPPPRSALSWGDDARNSQCLRK